MGCLIWRDWLERRKARASSLVMLVVVEMMEVMSLMLLMVVQVLAVHHWMANRGVHRHPAASSSMSVVSSGSVL